MATSPFVFWSERARSMAPFAFWKKRTAAGAAVYPTDTGDDPYWDYVVLCMNMDTPTPSTGFTSVFADESNVGKTPTISGSPYIETAAGSSPYSGRVGSAWLDGSGSYISFADSSDWSFDSGDATIEFFIRFASLPTNDYVILLTHRSDANNRMIMYWDNRTATGSPGMRFNFAVSGTWYLLDQSANAASGWSAGTWYHIAVVKSGTSYRLFRSGTLIASSTISVGYPDFTGSLTVGGELNEGKAMSGNLADLRIYRGVAKYTANFTPHTTPIGLGTANDKYWGYCVLACPFENSLKDMSGATWSNTGSLALSTSQKKYGSASASFVGGNKCLAVTSQNFAFQADFTIEAWIYLTAQPPNGGANSWTIASNWNDGAANARCWYLAYYYNGSTTQFNCQVSYDGASNISSIITNHTLSLNTWHHVALVRAGTTLMLFVDGSLIGSTSSSGSLYQGGTQITVIGNNYTANSPAGNYFQGYLDSLRITKGVARYTADFTPPSASFPVGKDETVDPFWTSTVLAMKMDNLTDATSRHAMTNNGSATNSTTVYKYGSASLSLNGTSQYLSSVASSDFALSSDFTIECWVRIDASHWSNDKYACFVLLRIDDNNNISFGKWRSGISNYLFATYSVGGTNVTVSSTVAPVQNTWQHVAVTRTGSTLRLFIDGVQVGSNSCSLSIGSAPLLRIGTNNPISDFMSGYIDDLRLTKGVARYVNNFTPPTRVFTTTPYTLGSGSMVSSGLVCHLDAGDSNSFNSGEYWQDIAAERLAGWSVAIGVGGPFGDRGGHGRVVIVAGSNKTIFNCTGADQSYLVPTGVTSITVKIWGAGGGGAANYNSNGSFTGGAGGYSTGTIAVTPGETLTVRVGQGGAPTSSGAGRTYGGGGRSGNSNNGQGGGSSGIFRSTSPLIMAGGGGGGGCNSANGGAGGGSSGSSGGGSCGGTGGTQSAGGSAPTTCSFTGGSGAYDYGGDGVTSGGSAGGGGGYYGGSGGSHPGGSDGAGGGGSGYIGGSGVSSASTTAGSGATPPNTGDSDYSASGYLYDFMKGSSSTADAADPTFVGVTGGKAANDYFSLDGGDYFASVGTSSLVHTLHKDNASFTMVVWVYRASSTQITLVSTATSNSSDGVSFYTHDSSLRLQVRGNSANALDLSVDVGVPVGVWTFCAVSVDEAAGAAGSFFYCNGRSSTFNATYSSPSSNAAGTIGIGSRSDGGGPATSGTRFSGVQLYSRALSKAELDQNFNAIRGRFGL